ncbi:MAG: PDZ domain-containing protein [Gemmatimonadetes bacterium]|nr:PDZ domain-containing protein [Gemmatimonadota bacterium]
MNSMRLIWMVTALTMGLGAPMAAQERESRREKERRVQELRSQLRELERELGRSGVSTFFGPNLLTFSSNRARLGAWVRTAADEETDRIGAYLESIDPGSAAEEAGLEAGDIIVSFEGEQLTGRYPPADADESEPAIKMIDLLKDYDPGDEVTVEYRRGDRTQSTVVTLDRDDGVIGSRLFLGGPGAFDFDFERPRIELGPAPRADVRVRLRGPGSSGGFTVLSIIGDVWSDIELVGLSQDLGRYFGTEEGLLVIAPPSHSGVELQSGDVILSIDGREPRRPSQALRILRSYEEGETVNLEIMRDRSRMTLSIKVPERENNFFGSGWNGRWEFDSHRH